MAIEDEDLPRTGVDAAYSIKGPEENRRFYSRWAATYDDDFVEAKNYIYPRLVSELLLQGLASPPDPVLDVGCGTGMVGLHLHHMGVSTIDGIDISPGMLRQAGFKARGSIPVYRQLIEADLTTSIDIASDCYRGIVSAGTFTHGHLGPESIDELIRVAAPGARLVLGINSAHFESYGFRSRLDRFRGAGMIGDYDLIPAQIYEDSFLDDPDHVAFVAVFAKN